jgi:hypothetical protein
MVKQQFKSFAMVSLSIFFFLTNSELRAQKVQTLHYKGGSIEVGDTIQLVKGSLGGTTYSNVFINNKKVTRMGSQFDGAFLFIKEMKTEKVYKGKTVSASLGGLEPFKVKCYLKEALESGEFIKKSSRKTH